MGRALSAGKAPTIPALHWAITSAGCEMMNNGAPTTGSRSLSLSTFGSAIEVPGPPNRSHINQMRRHGQGHLRRPSLRLGQPRANIFSASVAPERLRKPRQQRSRLIDQRVRRIDDEKAGARERLLAVRADGSGADVEFEPQDVRRAERRDGIEKASVGLSFADRAPCNVSPGRPFADCTRER